MRPPIGPRLAAARVDVAREMIRLRSACLDAATRASKEVALTAMLRELDGWLDLARLVERPPT